METGVCAMCICDEASDSLPKSRSTSKRTTRLEDQRLITFKKHQKCHKALNSGIYIGILR